MGSLLGEGGKNECGTRWRRGESWRQVETRGREAWRCVRTGKKQPMATWPWFYAPGRKWDLHLDRKRGFEEGSKGLPSELPCQSREGLLSSKRKDWRAVSSVAKFLCSPSKQLCSIFLQPCCLTPEKSVLMYFGKIFNNKSFLNNFQFNQEIIQPEPPSPKYPS